MTPAKIVASSYLATVFPTTRPKIARLDGAPKAPTCKPRLRLRWRAEFVGGRFHGLKVDGFQNPDDAVGALIREVMTSCSTFDELLSLVAGLFGNTELRSPEVIIGRALRMANRYPRGRHTGCPVEIREQPARRSPVKGGAA